MAWTLWRNSVCLGEVVAELPAGQQRKVRLLVYGLFKPTPAFADIGHLMQTRFPFGDLQPELRDAVYLSRFKEGGSDPGPKALRQMTPEEAAGLPIDEQFVLHDAEGRPVRTDSITLQSDSIPDGEGPWPEICRTHGIQGIGWLLLATCRIEPGSFDAPSG